MLTALVAAALGVPGFPAGRPLAEPQVTLTPRPVASSTAIWRFCLLLENLRLSLIEPVCTKLSLSASTCMAGEYPVKWSKLYLLSTGEV